MFSHFIFWRIKLMNENWKTFMTLPFFLIKYYAIVFGKCTYVEIFIWIACESDQTFWVNWLYASSSKSAFLMFWVMHVESLRAPLNLGGLTRSFEWKNDIFFFFFPWIWILHHFWFFIGRIGSNGCWLRTTHAWRKIAYVFFVFFFH